jgi:asparagine synthase (glutamine-hydrolysing)
MFAFAIYNKEEKRLFMARDRFGIKPLYYTTYTQSGKIAFASEIKTLFPALKKRAIDKKGVEQFFTFRFTLGETTMLKGVKKLLPGRWMNVDLKTGKIEQKTWYRFSVKQRKRRPYTWWKEELKKHVKKAVQRRMIADVPVSTFLSGGIDSSIITLVASKHNKELNTFSMGFETTNELPYARLVAKSVGTNHHELHLEKKSILTHLDGMVAHMDEPIGDPGFLPIYVLSQEVAKQNKVILSGDGADEILTGYDRYKLLQYGWHLRHLTFHDCGSAIGARLKQMRGKGEYESFLEIIRLFSNKELEQLGVEEFDATAWWPHGDSRVERAQHFDIITLLPGDFFMKADKMSSAWGLEQRVPFMDHKLVEFTFSIPFNYKLKLWNEKHILKEAFKEQLPNEITKRRKHGFNVPIDHWFKSSLGKKLKGLLKKRTHDLYEKSYVYTLLEQMEHAGTNYKENFLTAQKLWSILVFEMWYAQTFHGMPTGI